MNELELYKVQYDMHRREIENLERENQELKAKNRRLEDLMLSLKSHMQKGA